MPARTRVSETLVLTVLSCQQHKQGTYCLCLLVDLVLEQKNTKLGLLNC